MGWMLGMNHRRRIRDQLVRIGQWDKRWHTWAATYAAVRSARSVSVVLPELQQTDQVTSRQAGGKCGGATTNAQRWYDADSVKTYVAGD
jgi:hypothetical protein